MKLISALLFFVLMFHTAVSFAEGQDSTYDRVLKSETIRCGYINYPPHFIIDPVSGKKSGISYDIMEEAARVLGLKVEWAEELGWGNTVEALNSKRVDAVCTSFWQNPVEGKYVFFTEPMFYSAVGAYVDAENTQINSDLSNVNDPSVRVSASDGAISFYVAQQDFPKATILSLPNMTDETQMLMEVDAGKADIAFIETYLGEKFIKANPKSLKNLVPNNPVRLFGNTFALPMDDVRFKSMLDSALVPMIQGGLVDRIISKYEEVPGGIYRVAQPFEVKE
ncbi:MAG TPA: transporter substrate-binding domain-containing protein [Alphaproteobacteria bacterium]|nr:transporter substrate-binding domain-containing protein [Alphaproteobacteria bacterium]